ncbi:MAG TPA: peptidylprolyl isomerase [Candidatus Binatia bacterium]
MTQTGKNPVVVISTSMGDIEAELYPDEAPETVKNFLSYAEDGHYDGTIFHRVIKGFMIQGGGLTPDMNQKPTKAPIKNEADNGLKNVTGTLAMARTSVPDSATSQFFINVKDNGFLDFKSKTPQGWGYAVFGKVISGMDVVHKIENVQTTSKGMHQDVPAEPVVIKSIKVKSS